MEQQSIDSNITTPREARSVSSETGSVVEEAGLIFDTYEEKRVSYMT